MNIVLGVWIVYRISTFASGIWTYRISPPVRIWNRYDMAVQLRLPRLCALGLCPLLTLIISYLPHASSAYIALSRIRRPSATSLHLIGNLLEETKKSSPEPTLPRDAKDAVSACREAVQEALQKRMSRMDVEFPVGTKFSVEKDSDGGRKRGRVAPSQDVKGTPTRDQLDKSDRELARLFVEMFQPVGGGAITVAFTNEDLAEEAKKRWKGDASAVCKIVSIGRNKKGSVSRGMGGGGMGNKKVKKKRPAGFAAKMAAELDDDGDSGPFALPKGTEVALFIAPGPRDLIAIERICGDVGMGTLVVLINARMTEATGFGTEAAKELFLGEFESIFHLAAAPQVAAPGCLLHRAYPGKWVLARKPKVGPPKAIGVYMDRPGEEECRVAYDAIELSDVERGVESALQNVAGWFK